MPGVSFVVIIAGVGSLRGELDVDLMLRRAKLEGRTRVGLLGWHLDQLHHHLVLLGRAVLKRMRGSVQRI